MNLALDLHDTIAAIGSAPGAAARGIVRLSGPRAIEIVGDLIPAVDGSPWSELQAPTLVSGTLHGEVAVPCDLFIWPTERSYTRQPTVEIHTLGSAPLLECVLAEVCAQGARLADPGEFTLRAFLAGRIDLTQAEAVLGVIDSRGAADLDAALVQLAGGLSRPLSHLREQLVQILAELEAGLDFVEEDIEFISLDQLRGQLSAARDSVAEIAGQMAARGTANEQPRVVLVGPPNAGKSSLFNALAARWGAEQRASAIVSAQPGTTRDYLTAKLDLSGVFCELVDTAGLDVAPATTIASAAQDMTGTQLRQADLAVHCVSAPDFDGAERPSESAIYLLTKSDLRSDRESPCNLVACSSLTYEGLSDVCETIRRRLVEANAGSAVASTALRCGESLRLAEASLAAAVRLVDTHAGEELIAAEIRHALGELGRVVGAVYTDDLLDRIFSQFCIGK